MKKPMWDTKAVKAYETGQGVELVNVPYPHYEPQKMTGKQPPAPWNTTPPQRTWVGLDVEDYIKALELCDFDKDAAFDFFEAKLKELNT
jgi:hypothetical protein